MAEAKHLKGLGEKGETAMAFDGKTVVQMTLSEGPMDIELTLKEKFNLPSFRRGQKEIILSVVAQKDVLAVLPTGGGKSLCYQLPSVCKNELVIVISPLIALMKDQVASLKKMGIPAGCLHSGQSDASKREVFAEMAANQTFVLYLSPERAQKEGFKRWIMTKKVALFAIDEAHCVSQWGHDFREEYSQLHFLKKLKPDVPILALTASATPLVLNDIVNQLGLKRPERHIHGFYRPNLYYQVEFCEDDLRKLEILLQSIRQNPEGRVLVYCGTRQVTEELAEFLGKHFEGAGYYHAGMTPKQRNQAQEDYEKGNTRILVATNAFGMGIDHPDVRLVVHYQIPANIDSLYQEMGRAGRDNQHSTCLMLYAKKDKGLQSFFITQSKAPSSIRNSRWKALESLIAYAEGSECRHAEILHYYRDSQSLEKCGHCDNCVPQSPRRISTPQAMIQEVRSFFKESAPETKSILVRKAKKPAKATGEEILDQTLDEVQERRFQALRAWRRDKARELDTAAFVVFGDKTLKHLAIQNPKSLETLSNIYGIGASKSEKFGAEVLRVLEDFV